MKNYWSFMGVRSVIKLLRLFLLISLSCTYSYASECVSEYHENKPDYAGASVEFMGKLIPLSEHHVVKIPLNPMVYIVSRGCVGVIQYISIKERKDCIFCNASHEEFQEQGVKVISEGRRQEVHYLLLEVNDQTQLNIWNGELALTVKDQDKAYLKYILGQYGF